MAKFTKRQILTTLSITYLLTLTILAAYALRQIALLSLPIPAVHSALTLALPPLAGISLETIISSLPRMRPNHSSKLLQAVNSVFLIYESVLAALAGTHIAPMGGLWCPLHDKWTELFRAKDGEHIGRIQDALECCGFATVRDMAFPFVGGADACVRRYERDTACVEPWRDAERRVAVILLVIPVAVFLWKVALFFVSGVDESWLPSAIMLPHDTEDGGRPRQAILYRNVQEEEDADSLREEVNQLNHDSNLATRIEGGRNVRPSPLSPEGNIWSRGQ